MLRLYVDTPLSAGQALELPPGPARHVQVRRLQPGDGLVLFDGRGGEWRARVQRIGRQQVTVIPEAHDPVEREATHRVTLAVGMPANDRMDWLVEKATELGAAAVQPLTTARSVLRLDGDRAQRKQAHWQAIAVAAAEQCGRTRVPAVHPPAALAAWLTRTGPRCVGWVLSLPAAAGAEATPSPPPRGPGDAPPDDAPTLLSGPEGGLTDDEQQLAIAHGLRPWSLGARVLRAETAPLAALVCLTLGTARAP